MKQSYEKPLGATLLPQYMETVEEFWQAIRMRFPDLSAKTDRIYFQLFEDEEFEQIFLWFEFLADVINDEMIAKVPYASHSSFFDYVSLQVSGGMRKICECIDVALVENMFFHVEATDAQPYWQELPKPLKEFYLGFHGQPPI